jgi:CRISPR type III-B/RAMP module RAMP protein Cmr1
MKYNRKAYRCELLTPLIMAGADQSKAELRASSIKGTLRWWWRALQATNDIELLRRRELELFGGVFGEGGTKQYKSQVVLSVRWESTVPTSSSLTSKGALFSDAIKYLAYGATGDNQSASRQAFLPGEAFILQVKTPEADSSVEEALQIMLTYGGFGLKAKNGFGQVHCTDASIDIADGGESVAEYPNFAHWDHIRLPDSKGTYSSAVRAHDAVAIAYYRSKNPREKNTSWKSLTNSGEKNLFAAHSPAQFGLERKAKPVQLYVTKVGEEQYRSGIIAFPYRLDVRANDTTKAPKSNNSLSLPSRSHVEITKEFMQNVRENNTK